MPNQKECTTPETFFDRAIPANPPAYSSTDNETLKSINSELRMIRLLLQQVIGLPDTPETRAINKALRREGEA